MMGGVAPRTCSLPRVSGSRDLPDSSRTSVLRFRARLVQTPPRYGL